MQALNSKVKEGTGKFPLFIMIDMFLAIRMFVPTGQTWIRVRISSQYSSLLRYKY